MNHQPEIAKYTESDVAYALQKFFQHWTAGLPKKEAMETAQRDVQSRAETRKLVMEPASHHRRA